jgi:hypothetical protein
VCLIFPWRLLGIRSWVAVQSGALQRGHLGDLAAFLPSSFVIVALFWAFFVVRGGVVLSGVLRVVSGRRSRAEHGESGGERSAGAWAGRSWNDPEASETQRSVASAAHLQTIARCRPVAWLAPLGGGFGFFCHCFMLLTA